MLNVQRLGVVLFPKEGDKSVKYADNHVGEYAVFNAGMALENNRLHMLYRAAKSRREGEFNPEKMSVYCEDYIGYAEMTPQGKLIKDHGKVLEPSNAKDCAGTQDPRIVFFEGKYYIFYCGFNMSENMTEPPYARLGFAQTTDFNTYEKLGLLDLPQWDKDHFIFPERIGGKVCLVHRIEPEIYMDFFDSIDAMLDNKNYKHYHSNLGENSISIKRQYEWESLKIGGSVPPIKTQDGWLFIYHGVSRKDGKLTYCAGVALLDYKNPTKVIARLPEPILKPETDYEKHGDIDNVVFPVGGYIYEGDVYISYGGADRVVALAKINLEELLQLLRKHKC